jgi:TonB family protein
MQHRMYGGRVRWEPQVYSSVEGGGRGKEAAMFDDTRTAILPRSGSDRWGSLMLALGFHGAAGVTLLLAALLVVRPVEIFVPTDSIVVTIPIEIPASGGSPPPSAPVPSRPGPPSTTPTFVPDPLVASEPLPDIAAEDHEPWGGADLGFDLGPGVGAPGVGAGPGGFGETGDGHGFGPGHGPGVGSGGDGPVELSGEIEPPRLVVRVEPSYPSVARAAGVRGRVVLRAVIGPDGSVERVETVSASSPLLVGAAEEAVLAWRYEPARWRGQPVRVWFTVRVDFVLR